MADQETQTILASWGMPEDIIKVFKEAGIDCVVLENMQESEWSALMPDMNQMGYRVKFRMCWQPWVASLRNRCSTPFSTSTVGDMTYSSDLLLSTPTTTAHVSTSYPMDFNSPPGGYIQPSMGSNQDGVYQNFDPMASAGLGSSAFNPPAMQPLPKAVSNNYVSKLLNQNLEGRSILERARKNPHESLELSNQKALANLIIFDLFSDNVDRQITGPEFTTLSLQIKECLPGECASVYYLSSLPRKLGQKRVNAAGLLKEAYKKKKQHLRQLREESSSSSSRSGNLSRRSSTNTNVEELGPLIPREVETESLLKDDDNPIVEDHLSWLGKSLEPESVLLNKWRETAVHRLQQLASSTSKYDSVYTYFNLFPALRQPDGFKLLLEDFNHMHPGCDNRLYESVVLHRDRIFELARRQLSKDKNRIADRYIQNLISSYLDELALVDSFEIQNSIALLLLPLIIEVPSARQRNNKHFRPSRKMIVDSFILLVQEANEIENVVADRRKLLASKRRTLQPFVAVVGNFKEPRNVFIIIDNTHYVLKTITEAVDVLFKIFFATWTNFPCESEDIWLVLQLGFYKIPIPTGTRESSECRQLMNQIGLLTA